MHTEGFEVEMEAGVSRAHICVFNSLTSPARPGGLERVGRAADRACVSKDVIVRCGHVLHHCGPREDSWSAWTGLTAWTYGQSPPPPHVCRDPSDCSKWTMMSGVACKVACPACGGGVEERAEGLVSRENDFIYREQARVRGRGLGETSKYWAVLLTIPRLLLVITWNVDVKFCRVAGLQGVLNACRVTLWGREKERSSASVQPLHSGDIWRQRA